MPCLRYLVIRRCHPLSMLPSKLWSLTALQKGGGGVTSQHNIATHALGIGDEC